MLDNKAKELLDHVYGTSFSPQFKIEKGVSKYKITMDNIFLNKKGEVYKSQFLESNYIRNVLEKTDDYVWLLEYVLKSTKFHSNTQKPMQWNFVKDLVLPYYTFNYNEDVEDVEGSVKEANNYKTASGIDYESKARFDNAFDHLPKLPSVYLVIMMAYDIAGLENITAHICHNKELFTKPGEIIEVKSLSHSSTNIDMGFYSKESYFENSKIFGVFHGYVKCQGHYCAVVKYYSDASKLSIVDDSREEVRQKNGNSYYSGYVYIDLETSLPVIGTMLENVVAVQSHGEKKVSVNIRRRVNMNKERIG